jgi:hypothetical protein
LPRKFPKLFFRFIYAINKLPTYITPAPSQSVSKNFPACATFGLLTFSRQPRAEETQLHSSINADHLLRSLALSVARNLVGAMRPTAEIIASEGLTQTEYDQIALNPQFQQYVEAYKTELKDTGFSFSAKSRVLAEDLLPSAYHMARDPDVPAAVRAKILENLVDWGDLKPKNTSNAGAGPGFSITINIPTVGQTPAQTIVLEAETPQKALEIAENVQKPTVFLIEDENYEYAGDDYT